MSTRLAVVATIPDNAPQDTRLKVSYALEQLGEAARRMSSDFELGVEVTVEELPPRAER